MDLAVASDRPPGGVASAVGTLVESTYERDTEHFAVQAVSQDYVTLLVAVPAVLILGWLAWRRSLAARLMWHGVVIYSAYTYTIAAFMVRFNTMFLVDTTLLACSILALAGGLGSRHRTTSIDDLGPSWPRRSVIAFLGTVVVVFLLMWLYDIVPALLNGTQPESLSESATPTNGAEVLDLALLLPVGALAASWVQRSQTRGYVLATGLITYIALLGMALVAMIIGLTTADLSTDAAVSVVFVIATAVASVLLFLIVRSMRAARVESFPGSRPAQSETRGATRRSDPTIDSGGATRSLQKTG